MTKKIEKNSETEFYMAEVSRDLRQPLMSIAAAKGIEVRQLVTQVLRNFVNARIELLQAISDNGEGNIEVK